ncbi:MAG: hypothetical protein IPN17_38770 [Deltaproteobacteria bacterium]|nr:hypothetical protein [Deltaproteobacteria bacterium]
MGDLFDVLAGGEEPMDGTMRARWQAAKRLYQAELLPVIQTRHDTARPERCQRIRDEHRPENRLLQLPRDGLPRGQPTAQDGAARRAGTSPSRASYSSTTERFGR